MSLFVVSWLPRPVIGHEAVGEDFDAAEGGLVPEQVPELLLFEYDY